MTMEQPAEALRDRGHWMDLAGSGGRPISFGDTVNGLYSLAFSRILNQSQNRRALAVAQDVEELADPSTARDGSDPTRANIPLLKSPGSSLSSQYEGLPRGISFLMKGSGKRASIPSAPDADSEPALPCPFGCRSFRRKADLKRHIQCVHEKLKPYKCPYCGALFGLRNNKEKHVRAVHEGRRRQDRSA